MLQEENYKSEISRSPGCQERYLNRNFKTLKVYLNKDFKIQDHGSRSFESKHMHNYEF